MTDNTSLLHPLYMDIPMMVSFVAAIEGGYTLENTQTQTHKSAGQIAGQAEAEFGLSKIFTNFAAANVKGTGNLGGNIENSQENQMVWHHTEASLFMQLRDKLYSKGRIASIDDYDEKKWSNIELFSLVEMSGDIHFSPINEIIRIGMRIIPFMQSPQSVSSNRLTNEQKKAISDAAVGQAATISLIKTLQEDLAASPLSDMILRNREKWPKNAVLDLSVKIMPLEEQEKLRCGRVTVLGKVTRILKKDEQINLYRRSIFGYAAQNIIIGTASEFNSVQGISIELEAPAIEYPAVEIIPMAIYV